MAHEITKTDNVLLHKERAWHGLGIVVQEARTPKEGAVECGLGWTVEQWPMSATNGEIKLATDRFQANVRTDTKTILGVVSKGYQPVQNLELADFCEELAKQGDVVKIESCGSIRGGEKVWFLLKGESFSARPNDEIRQYICVSNGHDGRTSVRCTPTDIRVVCSNTLHMVIPQEYKEKVILKGAGCSFTHVGNVKEKIEAARKALGLYQEAATETRKVIDRLAARDVKREDVQRFFLECYTRDFGAIPVEPKTEKEERKKDKAQTAFLKVSEIFDREREIAGTTAWNAYNSYTGWLQNEQGRSKSREWSKLEGTDADRSLASLNKAVALFAS